MLQSTHFRSLSGCSLLSPDVSWKSFSKLQLLGDQLTMDNL